MSAICLCGVSMFVFVWCAFVGLGVFVGGAVVSATMCVWRRFFFFFVFLVSVSIGLRFGVVMVLSVCVMK